MIAIDTNILLRYLLQDDPKQHLAANELFEKHTAILITDVVLVETLWTLKGKRYSLGKSQLINVLDALFREPNIFFEDAQVIWRALNTWRVTKPIKLGKKKKDADFADILILEKARAVANRKGTDFEVLYSFDKAAQQVRDIVEPGSQI